MVDTTAFEAELNTDLAAEITASGNTVIAEVLAIKVKAVVRELITNSEQRGRIPIPRTV